MLQSKKRLLEINSKLADTLRDKGVAASAEETTTALVDKVSDISSDKVYSEFDDVCFWDYDGTLIYSCSLAEAHTMTEFPDPPDHSRDDIPLNFSEWNHTLEEINNLKVGGDIGALYSPIDGKTHFTVRVTNTTGLSVIVYWRWSNSEVVIDWGDGSQDVFAAASTGADATHEYSDYGEYQCSIFSEKTYNLGRNGSFLNDNCMLVGKFVMDENIRWGWPSAQGNHCFESSNIEIFVFSSKITAITGMWIFSGCFKLRHLNLSRGLKAIPHSMISSCCSIKHISVSGSFVSTGDYAFSGTSIERLFLPDTLTQRSRFTFNSCKLLKKVKLPSESENISYKEFADCYSLTEIKIPDSVKGLNEGAFSNSGIIDYYFYPLTPPVMASKNVFSGILFSAIIHVPKQSLELYQTATNWATYADYIVGDL